MEHTPVESCRACRLPLEPGALKCPSCESFQDWRRFLIVGDASLGLILAIVSLSALALPLLLDLVNPHAKVRALHFVSNEGGYDTLLANVGRADAFLWRAEVRADDAVLFRYSVGFDPIQKNSHVRHIVPFDAQLRKTLRNYNHCELRFWIVDVREVNSEVVLSVPCVD